MARHGTASQRESRQYSPAISGDLCRAYALHGSAQGTQPVLLMSDRENHSNLPPGRIVALRKWLRAANARLLSIERTRQDLMAAASILLDHLGPAQPSKGTRPKRPKPVSRM